MTRIALLLLTLWTVAAPADDANVVVILPAARRSTGATTDIAEGVRLAIQAQTETGALLGRKIHVQIADVGSVSDEHEAALAARIAETRPALVIGGLLSEDVLVSSPIFASAGVIQITPSASNPSVTEKGIPTLFRMIGRDDKAGKQEALVRTFQDDQPDFTEIITPVVKARADVVFLGAFVNDAALIVRQLRDHGFSGAIIGGDPVSYSSFIDLAETYGEGVVFVATKEPSASETRAALARKLEQDKGQAAPLAFNAYAAVEVWAGAVQRAGSFDARHVAEQLHSGSFDTVIGRVSFDAKGDLAGDAAGWELQVWRNGRREPWGQ